MEILIGLLVLIFVLILWIIFVPFYVRIDTDAHKYELSQAKTIFLSLHPGLTPLVRVRVFGIRIPAYKKAESKMPSAAKLKRKKPGKVIKRSAHAWRYLLKGVLKSFRLKRLSSTIDLNDVVLNAKLVPVLFWVNRAGAFQLSTNFTGQYFFKLELQGRISKLLWTFITFLTKK